MQFLDTTPNTLAYMVAGYAVIFGVLLIYVVSLLIRQRNLKRTLKAITDEAEPKKG